MRIVSIVIILLLAVSGMSLNAQENAGKMRRVLDGYRKAYGGYRASELLKSVTIRGEQVQAGQNYQFLLRKKQPNSIRYSLSFKENSIVCGYDGKVGWQRIESGEEVTIDELEGAALKALVREADFEGPLLRYFSRSDVGIRMLDTEVVDGRPTHKLEVVEPAQPMAYYYLSFDAYQIVRKDILNEEGAIILATYYRNYREVDGFPFPFEIENKQDGKQISLTTVREVEVNPGQLSFYFRKPSY